MLYEVITHLAARGLPQAGGRAAHGPAPPRALRWQGLSAQALPGAKAPK